MKIYKYLVLLFVCASMTACDDTVTFRGENLEYQVIATNSLLGVNGSFSDNILILDKDTFGRVLFAYIGNSTNSNKYILAVLISQKTTKEFSYFYDGLNFISRELSDWNLVTKDNVLYQFNLDEIVKLKLNNDWNQQLQDSKMFRTKIVDRKKDTISNSQQEKIFESFSSDFHRNFSTVLTTDKNGLSLYYMRKLDNEVNWASMDSYLVMIDSSGSLIPGSGFEKLNSIWDYQAQLYEFKNKNGWSFFENRN